MLVALLHCGALQRVPELYRSDPLRGLLWTAHCRPELLSTATRALGLSAATRRAWCAQWDAQGLERSGFRRSARRGQVPQELLEHLAPLVQGVLGARVRGMPGTSGQGPSWALRDTTAPRESLLVSCHWVPATYIHDI